VSNVIQNKGNIPDSTRKHVLAVMQDMNYIPNRLAQRLVTKKTFMIALLVPSIDNPFFAGIYSGIDRYIEKYFPDYRMIIGNIHYSIQREIRLIRAFRQEYLDGYIIVSNDPMNEEILSLSSSNIPVVLTMSDLEETPHLPIVTHDNFGTAYKATEYLIKLGHTRIGYIAGVFELSRRAQSRFNGFRQCLSDHDLPYEDHYFVKGGVYSPECGYNSFMKLYKTGNIPTAILCAADIMVVGILHAIRECDMRVPEDISVIGFDNSPYSRYMDPPLTTVSIDSFRLGYDSAAILFQLIEGKEPENPHKVFRGDLIERKSCARLR
ncbi:MAG: LacI family DNA-binding transcriptional regulator, partial [Spirochaetes bacterium]|nr:LacI family DNA-binding transcriptional regulator [Spirochaetota bacterium]